MIIVTGVQREPMDGAALSARIRTTDAGGLVVFEGAVRSPDEGREIEALEYESWEERANADLETIAREIAEKHGATGVVAVHRLGRLAPGEVAVITAVAAPHRAEAFAAARELIDRIKDEVTIWRKEITAGDARWLENQ